MEKAKPNLLILEHAEGKIEPDEYTPETVRIAEAIVRGEWHQQTTGRVICKCIDGRRCAHGLEGPNSAGGTLSLLVADDLTSRRYITSDMPIADGMAKLTEDLVQRGVPVGMHSDTHAQGEASGCGANDKLEGIYTMMVKKAEVIRELSEAILDRAIAEDVHSRIMANTSDRLLFSSGAEVRDAATQTAGEDASETLEGEHNEIVAVVNLMPGTTLDRETLETDNGSQVQAFNIDVWAFEESAREISEHDEDDIDAKVAALLYYNLATALVLCGPRMRVGILK